MPKRGRIFSSLDKATLLKKGQKVFDGKIPFVIKADILINPAIAPVYIITHDEDLRFYLECQNKRISYSVNTRRDSLNSSIRRF